MEEQPRDIGKGVWFSAMMFYSLIFSVYCQSVPSMTLGVSPNMTVQQEGTTVSLLCHVSGFNATTHFLSWIKEEQIGYLISTSKDVFVSNERYRVSFTEGVISTFNLTFSEVETTDNGTYTCNFIRQNIVLSVYPRDAFPSCSPNGPVTLTVGSPISCRTSGKATPSINGENGEWTVYSGQNGGAIFLKNVTTLDNSQTYFCVAKIPESNMNLSCTIGPLNVVDILSTISPKITTTGITVVKAGLSAGQLTGIVIGVVALIIIIAIHILCFRFDPTRWMLVKDYLIHCGSSPATSQAREDTSRGPSRSPPDVPMSREEDDVPHVYGSTIENNSVNNSQLGLPCNLPVERETDTSSKQADPYMELNIADKKPSLYAELKL